MTTPRRDFLRRSGALGAASLAARLAPLCAAALPAAAQGAEDYKALVCVFLYGGADGNNLVIPLDASGYARYAAVRPVSSGINIAQSELLPIRPAGLADFGLHPDLESIHPVFAQGKISVLDIVFQLNDPKTFANFVN